MSRRTRVVLGALAVLGACTLLALGGWFVVRVVAPQLAQRAAPLAEEGTSAADSSARGAAAGAADRGAEIAGSPPAGAEAVPVRGGRLRLPGSDPTTLDPALVQDVVSAGYMYEIYSGLVTLSPELDVIPDLATGWDVSPSGTVYTFTLHTDATFHDASPLTARDVVYSIERACDPDTGSVVAETYLGDIVGCADKLGGRASSVAGLAAPDESHVVITIDAPKAYFLSKLTYPTSFVLQRGQVEGNADWEGQAIGSGPFRLVDFKSEEALVLERHDGYYRGVAYLEAIEFDLRPVSAITLYENGELDATPVGANDLERVRDPLNPLSSEVVVGPGDLGITYVGFNTHQPPFDDAHVRRAFNLALDKRQLAAVVLRGAVQPADWILPPGMPGYSAEPGRYPFDPDRARAELAASRYRTAAGLPPITLTTSGEGGDDPVIAAVADYLAETLGVQIALEQAPWETFQQEVAAGEYSAFVLGWSADYPDPQDFLDVLFHSRSGLNHTTYSNPAVDSLLEGARLEQDEADRLALYGRIERAIMDDAPWLPLYTGIDVWLVSPAVHDFTLPPIVLPRLAGVWLEP